MPREALFSDFVAKKHVDLVSSMHRLMDDAHRADDVEALEDLRVVWDNYNALVGVTEILADNSELVKAVQRMEVFLDNAING